MIMLYDRFCIRLFLSVFFLSLCTTRAQEPSARERLNELKLDSLVTGRVTAYFRPDDRERAEEISILSENAAAYFERNLGFSFKFRVAVLSPDDWFSDIPGMPYAIPYGSIPEDIIFVPSSLEKGIIVEQINDPPERRRRINFILLHEFGHLAIKKYFLPESDLDYPAISWFNELLANLFAYAYVSKSDPAWAEAEKAAWEREIKSWTPEVLSLDWKFMNSISSMKDLGRIYGWYELLLDLKAADLYDTYGDNFFRKLKDELNWGQSGSWETASFVPELNKLAPGFDVWVNNLEQGKPQTTY